jgi:hypothetical protein
MTIYERIIEWCKQRQFIKWFHREFIANKLIENFGVKMIVLFILWILGLIPTWVGIGLYYLVSPETVWQTIALVGIIGFLLGGLQIALGFFLVMATFHIIATDV